MLEFLESGGDCWNELAKLLKSTIELDVCIDLLSVTLFDHFLLYSIPFIHNANNKRNHKQRIIHVNNKPGPTNKKVLNLTSQRNIIRSSRVSCVLLIVKSPYTYSRIGRCGALAPLRTGTTGDIGGCACGLWVGGTGEGDAETHGDRGGGPRTCGGGGAGKCLPGHVEGKRTRGNKKMKKAKKFHIDNVTAPHLLLFVGVPPEQTDSLPYYDALPEI